MQLLKIIFVVENAFSFFSLGLFLSSSFSFVRVRNLFLVEENIQKIIKRYHLLLLLLEEQGGYLLGYRILITP
jgi:hypothetical protein